MKILVNTLVVLDDCMQSIKSYHVSNYCFLYNNSKPALYSPSDMIKVLVFE